MPFRSLFVPLQVEMPFVNEILRHRSLSIVGLEKNTGKTVCLNYILRRLAQRDIRVAVTSIGVDGEQTDSVYATAKPEISLYEGTRFITSERHYQQRQLVSQILDVDERRTSLGRLVTAEVICPGKVILSGAATTEKLRQQIEGLMGKKSGVKRENKGPELTIVDGALSRLSLASPTVTDAMILATGAAVSPNLQQLVSKTRFVYRLINLPEVDVAQQAQLTPIEQGLWALDGDGIPHDLHIVSAFLLGQTESDLYHYGSSFFASGAVSDRLLRYLSAQKQIKETVVIVRDFTKLFISNDVYADFTRRGGKLKVLQQSKLIAVCLNPTSPQGYLLNSAEACQTLSEALEMPVYDVKKVNV